MTIIKQHKTYRGRFEPMRRDDLMPGVAAKIGETVEVYAGWLVEKGEPFAGRWAMQTPLGWPCAWVPSCDLADLVDVTP